MRKHKNGPSPGSTFAVVVTTHNGYTNWRNWKFPVSLVLEFSLLFSTVARKPCLAKILS